MDRSECTSRLLASAMHELRNALAVIRESVGLASDVARIQARGGDAAGNISKEMKDRTVEGTAARATVAGVAAGPHSAAAVSRSALILNMNMRRGLVPRA